MDFAFWSDMCPHSITVEPFASVDAYGAYSYGAAVTHRARIEGKNQIIMTKEGEERVSRVTIYVAATIGPQDRVTLPLPFLPSQPNIMDVRLVSDESGFHHSVVYA